MIISLLPVEGRGMRICYCRSLGTMHSATMGFQAPKPLTHLQFEASKSHWLSRRWCTSIPLLWRSVVKSPTHRPDSSPFGSLSKQWMDTRIRPGKLEWRSERRETAARRVFWFFFCIRSLQAAEVVSQSADSKWILWFSSKVRMKPSLFLSNTDCIFEDFCYWC